LFRILQGRDYRIVTVDDSQRNAAGRITLRLVKKKPERRALLALVTTMAMS